MTDILSSCMVSPLTKCNSATSTTHSATYHETIRQPLDLLALSAKVLKNNQRNQECNSNETPQLHPSRYEATQTLRSNKLQQLHEHETAPSSMNAGFYGESCRVSFCKGGNHATQELEGLIREISNMHGGDEEVFLKRYLNEVIHAWTFDMAKAVECFRDLASQTFPNIKWK